MWTAALPILYSVFSALIGTQSVLFSKTLAVLLRSTVQGDNQVRSRRLSSVLCSANNLLGACWPNMLTVSMLTG
jgi:hypothetical protein